MNISVLAIVNITTVKINVQDSAWKPFFSNSFVYIFRGVISHKNSMFNILRTSKWFPVVVVSFLHFY